MKKLKFTPALCEKILSGEKTATWRLFDDKDLQAGDTLDLVDNTSLQSIGQAKITDVIERTLGTISVADQAGHEPFTSSEAMYQSYREYYPDQEIDANTAVKIIYFKLI